MVSLDLQSPHRVIPAEDLVIHGPEGFAGMRKAGQLAAACLDMLTPHIQPGVTTQKLDNLAREFALDHGATPACLFYRGYTHTICTSVNQVICHGIPNEKPLKKGDIVNVDVTLIVDGWHGDTSRMYPVGEIKRAAQRLIDLTYDAMMASIAAVKPGATVGDLGQIVEDMAHAERFSVVDEFCGHGLGQQFHYPPNILHLGPAGTGTVLREGMFFTIEPMINLGGTASKTLKDGWTAITKDRQLSAQFEHSVGVTADGVEIFTQSPAGLHRPPYG